MKKKFIVSIYILFFFAIYSIAQSIATFEDLNSDFFNQTFWPALDGSFEIVDNPSKDFRNSTNKCVLNHRIKGTSSKSSISCELFNQPLKPIMVNAGKRYLHVFVYSNHYYNGLIRLRATAKDDKWLLPLNDTYFNFISDKWQDIVIDLNKFSISEIYGLYFMSQDENNTYPTDSYFYYDEIEITNNPDPRGVSIINKAVLVEDFEGKNNTPSFKMKGISDATTFGIVDNTDVSGANGSSKALKINQKNEIKPFSTVKLFLENPVLITDDTRYLHIMVKSSLSTIHVITNEPTQHWFSNIIPERNEWSDVVIDLMTSSYNLNNKEINTLEFCVHTSVNIPVVEWYIDEVAFSPVANDRIGKSTFLDNISCDLTTEDTDWTFVDRNPINNMRFTNNGATTAEFTMRLKVCTDTKVLVEQTVSSISLLAGETKMIQHELKEPIPGFYRYYIDVTDGAVFRNKMIRQIGYNPETITDTIDSQPDFDDFWNNAKAELAMVDPEYKVTFNKMLGNHKIYDVEMKSIKGNTIRGYLSVPNKDGKFPAILVSNGFGVTAPIPSRNDDFIEFNYNIRGMGISTDYLHSDNFFVNGLKDINTYYYRECYMDAIRALDFICSRLEVDTKKILAEGGSQGGALTFVLAALDNRILAAAPFIPFLSDFKHYYDIKENLSEIDEWPMDYLNEYMIKYNLSKEKTFENLSYFDIKNFASKITCPLLMGVGLQDPICPPHIHFAAFNQVNKSKEYYVCKNNGHSVDDAYDKYKYIWYNKILNGNSDTIELENKRFNDQIQTFISGGVMYIYNTTGNPVNLFLYSTEGRLIKQIKIDGSTSIKVLSGLYIVSVSDNHHHTVRKISVL